MPSIYSPGFWLLVACLWAIIIFNIKKPIIWQSLKATSQQWIPFAIATSAFVSMSEVMTANGMTTLIANTAGAIFGTSFLFISPL